MARFTEREESVEPNLTPLIDVVFVVLIMFIVVAPILELDRVHLAEGREENSERTNLQKGSRIAIHVHADNAIWINQREVDPSHLRKELARLHESVGGTPQLFHDRKAEFGTYQMVKNAAESAGFESLDVILEPR